MPFVSLSDCHKRECSKNRFGSLDSRAEKADERLRFVCNGLALVVPVNNDPFACSSCTREELSTSDGRALMCNDNLLSSLKAYQRARFAYVRHTAVTMDFLALAATVLKSVWLLGLGAAFLYMWRQSSPGSRVKARSAATNSCARDADAAQQQRGVLRSGIAATSGDAPKVAAAAKAGLSAATKAAQPEAEGTCTVDQVRRVRHCRHMGKCCLRRLTLYASDTNNAKVTQTPRAATGLLAQGTVSTSVPCLMHNPNIPLPYTFLRLSPAMHLNRLLWYLSRSCSGALKGPPEP